MKEPITSYVGLDIHKDSIAIAIAEAGRAAPHFVGTINPSPPELCKALRRQRCRPESTLLAYEAGPCGYGWVRYLRKQHWNCEVIAPSRITRSPSEQRVKTDRRDALMLARQSRAGDLVPVVVPDERDEAIRDLSRAREDICAARLRARQQLKALLLRHGHAYQGKTAVTFVAEIGDPRRFAHPRALMAYLGLVPSEFSSGQIRRQGSITKSGNKHARRILIEAAWTYRHSARISRVLEVRQQGQPKAVREISWRAQLRLTKRFRHLRVGRGLPQNKVCIAIARELAGFIWDIARQVKPVH